MKRIVYAVALLLGMSIMSSCEKSGQGEMNTKNIIGSWWSWKSEWSDGDVEYYADREDGVIEFMDNGDMKTKWYQDYMPDVDTYYMNYDYEYAIEGNEISMVSKDGDDSEMAIIKKVTKDELVLDFGDNIIYYERANNVNNENAKLKGTWANDTETITFDGKGKGSLTYNSTETLNQILYNYKEQYLAICQIRNDEKHSTNSFKVNRLSADKLTLVYSVKMGSQTLEREITYNKVD